MAQHHKYDIKTLEDLYPFELDIYAALIQQFNKKQQEK